VDEGALCVHQIELVVQPAPGLGDCGGVGEHADSSLDFRKIAAWDDGRWLVVDTDLEARWTPIDQLDRPLGLDLDRPRASANRSEAVSDEMTWPMRRLRFV
jgi:hypothetical protein